jgi:hypothetical protein
LTGRGLGVSNGTHWICSAHAFYDSGECFACPGETFKPFNGNSDCVGCSEATDLKCTCPLENLDKISAESCKRCKPNVCDTNFGGKSDTSIIGIAVGSVVAIGLVGVGAVLFLKRRRTLLPKEKVGDPVASASQAALTQSNGNIYNSRAKLNGSTSTMSSPGSTVRSNNMQLDQMSLQTPQASAVSRDNSYRSPKSIDGQGNSNGVPRRLNPVKMQARSPMQLNSNSLDRPRFAGESPPRFQTVPLNDMPRANPVLLVNSASLPRPGDTVPNSQSPAAEHNNDQ